MTIATVQGYLGSALANGGTLAVTYPTGLTKGDFLIGYRHRLIIGGSRFSAPEAITVSFNATTATITYNGSTTFPAGTRYTVELDRVTDVGSARTGFSQTDTYVKAGYDMQCHKIGAHLVNLGSPSALSATAVCAAQAVAGAGNATINGTKAASGVAPLGAPCGRAIKVVSSNAGDTTQTVTVTGTDMYGQTMTQRLTLNGTTTVTGTKAFATVTQVAVSAALAGNLSVGDTDVLGLPFVLPNSVFVLKEIMNNAAATAGTFVAAVTGTAPSATTGDVRGTYVPNTATDGQNGYALIVAIPDMTLLGAPQA